ncbi:MAG: hypothetical protein ACJARP_001893 [Vicingaceae bacterium]|jgi:hypothetical protein
MGRFINQSLRHIHPKHAVAEKHLIYRVGNNLNSRLWKIQD